MRRSKIRTQYDSSAQHKIQQVLQLSKELVFDHKISQNELYNTITNHLKAHSTTTHKVLYNTCYGGFSYSTQFEEFVGESLGEYSPQREGMYDHVLAFGRHVAEKYPKIASMVAHHVMSDVVEKYAACLKYKRLKNHVDQLVLNHATLQTWCSTSDDRFKLYLACDKDALCNRAIYADIDTNTDIVNTKHRTTDTVQDLIDCINAKLDVLKSQINQIEPNIDHNMLNNMDRKFPKDNSRKVTDEPMSFMDAVEKYGADHHAIWNHQHIVDQRVMRHMLILPPPVYENIDEKAYTTLGLLGASGDYAALSFTEVPQGLSWTICEYDGKEHVVVD